MNIEMMWLNDFDSRHFEKMAANLWVWQSVVLACMLHDPLADGLYHKMVHLVCQIGFCTFEIF